MSEDVQSLTPRVHDVPFPVRPGIGYVDHGVEYTDDDDVSPPTHGNEVPETYIEPPTAKDAVYVIDITKSQFEQKAWQTHSIVANEIPSMGIGRNPFRRKVTIQVITASEVVYIASELHLANVTTGFQLTSSSGFLELETTEAIYVAASADTVSMRMVEEYAVKT